MTELIGTIVLEISWWLNASCRRLNLHETADVIWAAHAHLQQRLTRGFYLAAALWYVVAYSVDEVYLLRPLPQVLIFIMGMVGENSACAQLDAS